MVGLRNAIRRGGLVLCAVLVLALAACSSVVAPGQATPAAAAGALDFRATTLDGAALDVATLAGTPVVAWFWTPS